MITGYYQIVETGEILENYSVFSAYSFGINKITYYQKCIISHSYSTPAWEFKGLISIYDIKLYEPWTLSNT